MQEAELLVSGPLNDAYRIWLDGRPAFLRVRTYKGHDDYAQQFAAERLVYPRLPAAVRRPELYYVGPLPGTDLECAVFEWLEGKQFEWTEARCGELAHTLSVVHSVEGRQFGPIGNSAMTSNAARSTDAFFRKIFTTEIERLATYSKSFVPIYSMLLDGVEHFIDERPRLCHGDIYEGNLMVTSRDVLHLIDWEATRWRVPAADFNQIQVGWISADLQARLIGQYAALTGRSAAEFARQVAILQAFWHLRTSNFTELSGRVVFGLSVAEHLRKGAEILEGYSGARS